MTISEIRSRRSPPGLRITAAEITAVTNNGNGLRHALAEASETSPGRAGPLIADSRYGFSPDWTAFPWFLGDLATSEGIGVVVVDRNTVTVTVSQAPQFFRLVKR